MVNNLKIVVLAMIFGSFIAVSADARPYQPLTCKSWVSGNGKAFVKPVAKVKAKIKWRNKVTGMYGAAWSNFSLAKVGAFQCNKIGAKWSCTVRAKPCKKIGFGKKRAN